MIHEIVCRILEIYFLVGLGYLTGKFFESHRVKLKNFFRDSLIYLLVPLTILNSYDGSEIILFNLVSSFLLFLIIMFIISSTFSYLAYSDSRSRGSALLCSLFQNAVFLGFPMVLIATDNDPGSLIIATVIMLITLIAQMVTAGILGVVINAKGNIKSVLSDVLGFPPLIVSFLTVYFVFEGISSRAIFQLTLNIFYPLFTLVLSNLTTIFSLFLIGLYLSEMKGFGKFKNWVIPTLIKSIISPLTAILITSSLGINGLTMTVFIIQASMPPAVLNVVFAEYFNLDIELATDAILFGTVLSIALFPVWVHFS